MLPSPVRRRSPGRELKVENSHRRGRSLDYGPSTKNVEEEDLTLFNDMEMKEKDNLLLSNEDFDDSLAKLKCSTDYNFGMNIHVRGGSSDLLNMDSDKNDYDWLLTPPETPLFPYLDDDEPPPAILSTTRGRLRSQPMSIPRFSASDNSQRGSGSPHRLSPSSRSGGGTIPSRGRSPSARQSSPVQVGHPTTPSRRSPTPNKSPSPTPRSSAPMFRRMSVDSSSQTASPGRRGASPMKGSRGGSASPKLQGWQSSIPGFFSDAPPNLRTSIADRPASYTRGSSPASRNGRDLSSRIRRQSMSPTASRSASSSRSHDLERTSPHSKDSSTSFADEEVDSLTSISTGISSSPVTRKMGPFASNKYGGFSKRPSKTVLASSTPKRSLDSTLRQTDQHKAPQNMFRPLLSSVPISSFHIGKANAMHRPVFSRNSSLTTSSNESSELGASVAPENEGIDNDNVNHPSEWDRISDSLLHEEELAFEKMDGIKEVSIHDSVSKESLHGHEDFNAGTAKNNELDESQKLSSLGEPALHPLLSDSSADQLSCCKDALCRMTCSICGNIYTNESNDPNAEVCEECFKEFKLSAGCHLLSSKEENTCQIKMSNESDCFPGEMQLVRETPDIFGGTDDLDMVGNIEDNAEQLTCQLGGHPEKALEYLQGSSFHIVTAETRSHDQPLLVQQLNYRETEESSACQLAIGERDNVDHETEATPVVKLSDDGCKSVQPPSPQANASLKFSSPEATGISVLLLKRSSSSKGPLVQARAFAASNLHCDGPTYARENAEVVKPSISRNNSLASSSLDMGPPIQRGVDDHQQSSTSTIKFDTPATDINMMGYGTATSDVYIKPVENGRAYFLAESKENDQGGSLLHDPDQNINDCASFEERGYPTSFVNLHTSQVASSMQSEDLSESFASTLDACQIDSSATVIQVNQVYLHHHDDEIRNCGCTSTDEDSFANTAVPITNPDEYNGSNNAKKSSSSTALNTCESLECTKAEDENCHNSSHDAETSHSPLSYLVSEKECYAFPIKHEDANSVSEASTMMAEGSSIEESESSTLAETTDAILFCSSIVHDLVYEATTIGIEKESSTRDHVKPTLTVLERPVSYQREQMRMINKRTTKSQRVKKENCETDINIQEAEPLKTEKLHESPKNDSRIPHYNENSKPPSKCNCAVM